MLGEVPWMDPDQTLMGSLPGVPGKAAHSRGGNVSIPSALMPAFPALGGIHNGKFSSVSAWFSRKGSGQGSWKAPMLPGGTDPVGAVGPGPELPWEYPSQALHPEHPRDS